MPHAKPLCRVRAARAKDLEAVAQFLAPFVADGRILPRTADELSQLLRTGFVAVSGGR